MTERLLIYRLGSLGDTVVALPCFHKIANEFPQHERIVLTNIPVSSKAPSLASILSGSGLVHSTLAYPVRTRSPLRVYSLAKQIRALGVKKMAYLVEPRGPGSLHRDLAFFRLCGIQQIIGVPQDTSSLRSRVDSATGEQEPECERLARSIASLGSIDLTDPRNWDLRLTAAEHSVAEDCLAPLQGVPFIAINMGGKVIEKDWGIERWRQLLAMIADEMGHLAVISVGSPEDRFRAEQVALGWPNQWINLCGVLSPRESAAVLSSARLFIGHDSGPMHLAAVVGCPIVALFGSLNRPRKWYPYIGDNKVLHDTNSVRGIDVGSVVSAVRDLYSVRA